jgi:hypothetical protein
MNNQLTTANVNELVQKAKEALKTAKNIAVPEAWNILQLAVADIIQNIENNNPNLAGADKKVLAMNMVFSFYDQVFTMVNFPFVPVMLQPIIQKYVKQLLMIMIGASIDAMVTTFRNTGVFNNPTVDTKIDVTPSVSEK